MIRGMTAEPPLPELTASAEDYLKAIYAIERGGDAAPTNELAQRLGVAPASVSGMVRRLADQGLLTYERYRGARLTGEGRRAALRTLRRHRILESYLTAVLGYTWDHVHDEAERLEHAASDELIDRMAAALGDPAFDPHGAPIPTREGAVDEPVHAALARHVRSRNVCRSGWLRRIAHRVRPVITVARTVIPAAAAAMTWSRGWRREGAAGCS